MPIRRAISIRLAAIMAAALAMAACGPSQPPLSQGALYGTPIGGAFELVDTKGETVRWSDFEGKWRMVYFGYAYCPDICPYDVQTMVQGYNSFASENPGLADDVVPIFITVDAERDTPEVVAQFVTGFSEELIGLTGTQEQIKQAADAFYVQFSKGEVNEAGGYLVDHSRAGYLMGRSGEPIALLSVDVLDRGETVARELATWVR